MYSMILAMDKNGLIGNKNKLPWNLPADLKHFKKTTINKIIVMGKMTFESIGKALPDRTNIVLTTDKNFKADNVIVFHDIDSLNDFCKDKDEEIIIIGGANLIKQLYSNINKLYITHINHVFNGDCFVKFINFNQLTLLRRENFYPDIENNFFYSFCEYEKKDNYNLI